MCYFVGGRMSMEVTKKQCTPNFPKNKYFLPPDNAHTCACGGVTNVRFSENLACFVFLLPSFLTYTLSPYHRRLVLLIVSTYAAVYSIKPFHVFQHSTAFLYPLKMSGAQKCFQGVQKCCRKLGNSDIIWNFGTKLVQKQLQLLILNPAGSYLYKVNNRNTRTRCEICAKLRRQFCNFNQLTSSSS